MGAKSLTATARLLAFAFAIAAAGGVYAVLRAASPQPVARGAVWTEIAWPFAIDQWGGGRAFRCPAAGCDGAVDLYLRAKIGFCNCAAAIDDDEVDRVADFDFVGGEPAPLSHGRSLGVIGMDGRSRHYALAGRDAKGRSALVVALHDRCDMIVATAVAEGGELAAFETAVIDFLSRDELRRWAEVTLGL
jgi:hypothetical protein